MLNVDKMWLKQQRRVRSFYKFPANLKALLGVAKLQKQSWEPRGKEKSSGRAKIEDCFLLRVKRLSHKIMMG